MDAAHTTWLAVAVPKWDFPMPPLDPLRSFLPITNPLGFGASDFFELGLAALLVCFALTSRRVLEPWARRFAERPVSCMMLLAAAPVALRLLLLPNHPVPTPDIYDEFGHLLVADTLRHFRLANPPHALPQFFETFFVLQRPTYSSIYPAGQGLVLAIGWTLFGTPWAGVILATAAFCALCYWMLRAWVPPLWALAGGALAVIEFGPLCQWMNSYWGGAVTACAGCLVFGALPRLKARPTKRDAALLGLGCAIHLLTRPYEAIFLFAAVALYFAPMLWRSMGLRALIRVAPVAGALIAPAIGITLVQNKAVTGSWTTLPYQLSQYQYGVPAALTFQTDPEPHAPLTPEQQMDYRMQRSFRGASAETLSSYVLRLEFRVRYYRFFFLPALYLVLPLFLVSIRQWKFLWAALTLALFALGINFFPAYQLHYAAACTCLMILAAVTGLQKLAAVRREAARIVLFLCAAHFLFWYSMHLFENTPTARAALPFETWDAINHQNPQRRIYVNRELAKIPGDLLVFVRYQYPQHPFQDEWVYNAADIDHARIVWARDLGAEEDAKLEQYYPGRKAIVLEPDERPPSLEIEPPSDR
jgi:hypothetical protein